MGRSFASARVTGQRAGAVTPGALMLIGRELVLRGECAFQIVASGAGMALLPVSRWYVTGGPDPLSWRYALTLAGPTEVTTRQDVPAADVVHVRINTDPSRPWMGRGAASNAALTSDLAAKSTGALLDEAKSPRGSFIPTPGSAQDALAADVKNAKGAPLIVESQ